MLCFVGALFIFCEALLCGVLFVLFCFCLRRSHWRPKSLNGSTELESEAIKSLNAVVPIQ